MASVYDFAAESLSGGKVELGQYRGRVLLIVNTASQCGFTPQYQGLENLHRDYGGRGLAVLGFPCNQFGRQEPGDAAAIGAFCEKNYGVSFPMFAKVDVNGGHAHPLYVQLKRQARGIFRTQSIKWNFTKFLVKKDGSVYRRYGPRTAPEALRADIEKLLAE
ncbi:glutathione peroxidase [Janthinobacterium sp. 17J80-10]|uniref:glutathione peroxidase n=1 Tax=Janthinobacterium sp. 17J80-10 TaxID=2497863 RepID=UPI001005A10A|nr:glutathione peroxidase [Janthinobacterium sp. 17J80-10]QAU35700.1 glutathione peroxidase [Janthinobacterium sp. 17J80-10]